MDLLVLLTGVIGGTALAAIIFLLWNKGKKVSLTHFEKLKSELTESHDSLVKLEARLQAVLETKQNLDKQVDDLKTQASERIEAYTELNKQIATLQAEKRSLIEKLENQKKEIEDLGKKFNLEFQNIANKILDEKSAKFTKQNQENLDTILKPLGENISNFRKKVEDVYEKEAKQRFHLGEEVKRLVDINKKVSEEANNLANALRGNSKVQGDWGQMILENILEQSGLEKDREYFVQEFLKDQDGKIIKSEEGRKMQPDVIIAYPDNRKVIIDSKVSLTAYSRYAETDDPEIQKVALKGHLDSMRVHIDELSGKNYQDFAASLDFVMMFVPNEPAYLLALKNDSDLWHYAYSKRILFISPTNLIAVLKIIADLWKREQQNQNAKDIAERGAALYDKFAGLVKNLEDLGEQIDKTQKTYKDAFNQLKDGRGNLIGQVEKLKKLGVPAKKQISRNLLDEAGD